MSSINVRNATLADAERLPSAFNFVGLYPVFTAIVYCIGSRSVKSWKNNAVS